MNELPQNENYNIRSPEKANPMEVAREVIDNTDWKVIRGIFDEERRQSGVSENLPLAVGSPEHIHIYDFDTESDSAFLGIYNEDGTIGIAANTLSRTVEASERHDVPNAILSVLIHEQTHAAGRNQEKASELKEIGYWAFSALTGRSITTGASGYSYSETSRGGIEHNQFHDFNEAVTDLVAQEVYEKYHERTGIQESPEGYMESYLLQKVFLESFMSHVSTTVGIPREVVWQGIKQGYFAGLELGSTNLAALFNELALYEVMEKIRHVKVQELPKLTGQLGISELTPEIERRIEVAFAELENLLTEKLTELEGEDNYPFVKEIQDSYRQPLTDIGAARDNLGIGH